MTSHQTPVSGPSLVGRVGIVTGGGEGLGRAFAFSLAAAGAAVVVTNRNRQGDRDGLGPADHVVREIGDAGGEAIADHGDVADPGSVDAVIAAALDRYGRIDFLVTSAAVSNPEMFHKATPARFDAVTDINIGGTAHLAAACSAMMRPAGFGRIVLIASTACRPGETATSSRRRGLRRDRRVRPRTVAMLEMEVELAKDIGRAPPRVRDVSGPHSAIGE